MAIAYGFVYQSHFLGIFKLIFFTIGIEFLLCGMCVATLTWFLTNTYLQKPQQHVVEQDVEWMYCFDVHSNAFFPFFVVTYVIQFLLLAFVSGEGFFGRFVSNTLYFSASSYYFYVTFLGFHGIIGFM
jgi:hypothetical protein